MQRSQLERVDQPQLDDHWQREIDINLAQRRLKWHPKISLEQGLEKSIDYLEKLLSEVSSPRGQRVEH